MKRLLAILSLSLWVLPAGARADTAPRSFRVDAAYVTQYGSGPRAVILIPGLASGAYVYDGVVSELAQRYTVYTITFAGFDGEPAVQPPYLDAFDRSIVDLIAREKLQKPVLVGHSLGGHLVFRLAEELGDALGGAFVVDGLPIFPPPKAGETPADRAAVADAFRNQITGSGKAAFATNVRTFIGYLVIDPKNADMLATRSLRSDRDTYAGAAAEYFAADLRPNLPKIAVPLELLAPAASDTAAAAVVTLYRSLCAGVPRLDVETVVPARHFIMYDAPEKFRAALDAYLASLPT